MRSLRFAAVALSVFSLVTPAWAETARVDYDIPAQRLDRALLMLAAKSGRQITFAPEAVSNLRSRGLRGGHTFAGALERLLPARGVRWEMLGDVILILPAATDAAPQVPAAPRARPAESPVMLDPLEVVAVTGSRARPRVAQDSPVPIDVIPEAEWRSSGFIDTNNVLMTLIPSYAVGRNSNADAGTFVRPATLRGLWSDKTLLLVNSKRRHRAAAVGPGAGAQAADSATIPASAIQTVEVLRDGAGALYGSDAIAGVINFLLRDDAEGGALTLRYGEYYAGDGEDLTVAANIGAPLTEAGFLNLSFEYAGQDSTSRGRQFCNATFCVPTYAAQNPGYAALIGDVEKPVQRHGQPSAEAVRGFFNSGVDLSGGISLYAFGNYSHSWSGADATYRYPVAGQPINDVPVRLENGRIFRFNEMFPAGFTPRYSGIITDRGVVAGLKGETKSGVQYDLSGRYGENRMRYEIENTVNPTLGPDSPREFMRAVYTATEGALNADFGYDVAAAPLAGPITVAFGAEYRREAFRMAPGEPAAYAAGPYSRPDPYDFCTDEAEIAARTANPGAPAGVACASPADPVYNTLPPLTLTVSPSAAGTRARDSYAGYVEASADLTSRLFVDLAARHERFSDFGSTFDGKASGRLAITPRLNVRASAGTGFRAPTPGQQAFSTLQINTLDGVILQTALFPVDHPVAAYLGAAPLKPERSLSLSAGVTASLRDSLNVSIDLYQTDIRDQYYSVPPIPVTPAMRAAMTAANVAGAAQISRVYFFQNAFDSRVSGVDIVATERLAWASGQTTALTASVNYNRYDVRRVKIAGLFDAEDIFDFENGPPRWRGIITAVHTAGGFSALVRSTIWGPYRNMFSAQNPVVQEFRPSAYVDVELAYRFDDTRRITLGARNIFDEYPAADRTGETTAAGQIYRPDSFADWQGGFLFLRLDYAF